ncbi:MAG: phospho-sugar mutase [Syntrophobacterales bacterium]
MSETAALIDKVKNGFQALDVSVEHQREALKWLEIWLTDDIFRDYVPQITYLIESEKWNFLLDSFYQVIPFGTGGRRGLVGIGPNRINPWTIQASAQGHAQYLINQHGKEAQERGVVLSYDVRQYTQRGVYDDSLANPIMNLDGPQLAEAAAAVYAANGIKVYIFDGARSTPALSFAIRHLNAVSGDMFSASHNLPTDNGKKVYDQHGGQLIPPDDQILVDEVTKNVKEIKIMNFGEAKEKGLISYVGEEVDMAFLEAICNISLSEERGVDISYAPLHGTGLSSIYPALQKLGFNVTLDARTSNLSGNFENVTFNIPNPEVIESFETSIPFAQEINADLIISSDPDADRIGVMARHHDSYEFVNGNEIGIVLTNYVISKYKAKGILNPNSVVIKTGVTTSLIEGIAQENNIHCIGDLLVGFKYIGDEMNKLENDGRIQDFIIGAEESHGILTGDYCRDKDAAGAAVWIAELAAELKKDGKTLIDYLDEIYCKYGYCHNYLTEIRLLGAKGMEQIADIMTHLRDNPVESFGEFFVQEKIDRWQGEPQPHLSITDTASRNVLIFKIDRLPDTKSIKVTVRPSGTEPKIKMYFEVYGEPCDLKNIDAEKQKIVEMRNRLERAFMLYCYRILGVDFPERGFLLFWQLPLNDKLKYFETEEEIIQLKNIQDLETRKKELYDLLEFLGADPIAKVNDAFKEKYKKSIHEYLDIVR